MARTFAKISIAELKKKVEAAYTELNDLHEFRDAIDKDLKAYFDWENYEDAPRTHQGPDPMCLLMGYHSWPNGLTFLGSTAGGDWEHPVFFVTYWDGKKLRAYVPTDGNPWNTDTKEAYGNDAEKDLKNAKKRYPGHFKDCDEVEPGDFDFEPDKIRDDILARLVPAPTKAPAPTKPKKKPKQDAIAATKAAAGRAKVADRIAALTYYGTGDEAYELFQKTCGFCYALTGLGFDEEAAQVCGWAEEMAKASVKDVADGVTDADDFSRGVWGYN